MPYHEVSLETWFVIQLALSPMDQTVEPSERRVPASFREQVLSLVDVPVLHDVQDRSRGVNARLVEVTLDIGTDLDEDRAANKLNQLLREILDRNRRLIKLRPTGQIHARDSNQHKYRLHLLIVVG